MVYLNDSDDEMLRASEIEAPLLCVFVMYSLFLNVFERAKIHFFLHLLFLVHSRTRFVVNGIVEMTHGD